MKKAFVLGGLVVALAVGGYLAATKIETSTEKYNCGDGQLLVSFSYNYLGNMRSCHVCINGTCDTKQLTLDECAQVKELIDTARMMGICVPE